MIIVRHHLTAVLVAVLLVLSSVGLMAAAPVAHASASITSVQSGSANPTGMGTSFTVTLPAGVTQGDLLVINAAVGNNATTITAPSGLTQAVINQPAGSSATIESAVYYDVVTAAQAGTRSWTFTLSASHTMYLTAREWSSSTGWATSPLDKTAKGDTVASPATSRTIDSGTTAATGQASELWDASLAYKNSAQTESGLSAGWTSGLESTLANNNTMREAYQAASATGTADAHLTIGTAEYWAGTAATFETAAGGGGGSIAAPSWNPNGTYTNTFDDEFNSTALDSTKWETGFNCGLGNNCVSPPINPSVEENCYNSNNVTEPGDGSLHMALQNVSSTCGGSTKPYTGSYLDSKLTFNQTGGSWESRVYIPSLNGQGVAFPAYWVTNSSTADEVDIFEVLPDGNFGYAGNTVAHTHSSSGNYRCASSTPLVGGWHNFGVSVNTATTQATFYYDSSALCTVPMNDASALHIVFDNAMSAQALTPTVWPSTLLIDWTRSWSQA